MLSVLSEGIYVLNLGYYRNYIAALFLQLFGNVIDFN